MNITLLSIVVIYFALMFVIGFAAMRRIKDSKDFFLGGKKFGPWLTAFKFASTWESGVKLMGTPGQAWNVGWGAFAMGMATPLCYFFSFRVFGQRLKMAFDHFDVLTMPQLLAKRYNSQAVRVLAAITIIIGLGGALTGQYKATGEIFSAVLGVDYVWGLVIGVVIVGVYSIMGGYLASVWTDFAQGLVMVVGSIIIFVAAANAAFGGLSLSVFSDLNLALSQIDPNFLTITGGGKMAASMIAVILIITCLVGLAQPQQSIAIFSMRDVRVARSALIICTVFSMILAWTLIPAGLMGRLILDSSTVANPDQVIPLLIQKILSPVLGGIFLAAILAAIMSTVDGAIMVVAAVLSEDIIKPLFPKAHAKHSVLCDRAGAAGIILITLAVSINPPTIIFWIAVFSMGFVVFTFLMPMMGVIYIRKASKYAAIIQMVATMIIIPLWALGPRIIPESIWKSLPDFITKTPALMGGLIIAPVVFLLIAWLTRDKDPVAPETEALWQKFKSL